MLHDPAQSGKGDLSVRKEAEEDGKKIFIYEFFEENAEENLRTKQHFQNAGFKTISGHR
jgi:hypothetical protein